MPIPVLETALNQSWDRRLPSSIGHDTHRATGWVNTIALHLQPGLARLFGAISYAETADEMDKVKSILTAALAHKIRSLDRGRVDELRAKLDGFLSTDAQLLPQACASFCDKGLAARVFPKLFAAKDKDGLIPFRLLNPVAPGVFEENGLLLFAHPYFRRSLSRLNSLNDPFLAHFQRASDEAGLDFRIALDEDLIGHPDTLLSNIELQYWWGPKFTSDLADIPAGVTRHEASEPDRLFNAVSATEFWWYEQDGRKTFECEEIRHLDIPSLGHSANHYGCRFVHSILDKDSGLPIHLDGAVRLYTEDLMLERVDKDILHFGRRADYTKLWRIDGSVPVDVWKELINHYYRDNHLVGEYFGGKEEGDCAARPREVSLDQGGSIHDFAPCTMSRGDGVRISISYSSRSENAAARRIVPTTFFDIGAGRRDCIEACTMEVIKLTKRRGATIDVPDEIPVLAFEDMVSNLPVIAHGGQDSVLQAQITLQIVGDWCRALRDRKQDRMVSFHIAVQYEDRDAYFSFAGQVDEMCTWLESDYSRLPTSRPAVGDWAEAACDFLTRTFPAAKDLPPLENMLKLSGLLMIDRKFLSPGEFEIRASRSYPPQISLLDCPSIQKALPLVKDKGLVVSQALVIKDSECQRCHERYATCGCIKDIDPEVWQQITDFEILGVFWTDRSAWDVVAVDELPDR